MILFLGEHRNYSNLHDFWIISFLYDFASGPGEKECLTLLVAVGIQHPP